MGRRFRVRSVGTCVRAVVADGRRRAARSDGAGTLRSRDRGSHRGSDGRCGRHWSVSCRRQSSLTGTVSLTGTKALLARRVWTGFSASPHGCVGRRTRNDMAALRSPINCTGDAVAASDDTSSKIPVSSHGCGEECCSAVDLGAVDWMSVKRIESVEALVSRYTALSRISFAST